MFISTLLNITFTCYLQIILLNLPKETSKTRTYDLCKKLYKKSEKHWQILLKVNKRQFLKIMTDLKPRFQLGGGMQQLSGG